MAQVTGYTAERMKAIEDASVVNGDIDGSGHLILTRFDESTIDAGVILTSPKVVTSGTRPTGADLFDGLIIYETDTKRYWSWNDTVWVYIGGVFFCTSTTRPASPFAGLEIYETNTKRKYIYTGTDWFWLRKTNADRNTASTDATGNIVVAHGLGVVPSSVVLSLSSGNTLAVIQVAKLVRGGVDANNFAVYIHRTDTNTFLATTQVFFDWQVSE